MQPVAIHIAIMRLLHSDYAAFFHEQMKNSDSVVKNSVVPPTIRHDATFTSFSSSGGEEEVYLISSLDNNFDSRKYIFIALHHNL